MHLFEAASSAACSECIKFKCDTIPHWKARATKIPFVQFHIILMLAFRMNKWQMAFVLSASKCDGIWFLSNIFVFIIGKYREFVVQPTTDNDVIAEICIQSMEAKWLFVLECMFRMRNCISID